MDQFVDIIFHPNDDCSVVAREEQFVQECGTVYLITIMILLILSEIVAAIVFS
jgi:hypothetical protein